MGSEHQPPETAPQLKVSANHYQQKLYHQLAY